MDDESTDADASGRQGPRWLGTGWARPLALLAALAFLAGTIGYAVGTNVGPPSSQVDEGFLQDMSDHHEQARTMAILATEHATDPVVRNFAREVIIFQQYELGLMSAYLADRGLVRADADRLAMEWMGMPTPVAEMPGMATEEQLAAQAEARGVDADIAFLELMIEHHKGGLHMSEDAKVRAEDPKVRALAEAMANVQAGEINEYQSALDRLRAQRDAGLPAGTSAAQNATTSTTASAGD